MFKTWLRPKKLVIIVSLLMFALFFITEMAIVYDGFTDEIASADVALILGTKVNVDGNPSGFLRGRLDRGLLLFQEGIVSTIIVSGGLGKEGHYEGDAMAAYLMERGVDEQALVIDNEGINTAATARNYVKLQQEYGFESVIVVSQFFHISRCRLILRKMGVKNIGAAHSTSYYRRDIYSTAREFAGYYAYLFLY